MEKLENLWDEYQFYENDELNPMDDSLKMQYRVLDKETHE
jgi:conjugal transfer/entry exclusion protein